MEDRNNQAGQLNPEPPRRMITPLVALPILIGLGVLAYYFAVRGFGWDPAAYLPGQAATAVIVDFSASPDKIEGRDFVLSALKDAGLTDPQKQAFDALSGQLGVDFEREILPLLNGKGGIALGTESGFMPSVTAVVGTRSDSSAARLMDIIKKKLGDDRIAFTTAKDQGVEYLKLEYPATYTCVGALGSGVLLTIGAESAFHNAVATYRGTGKPSLARNQYYMKCRPSGKSTFLTVFSSGSGFCQLAQSLSLFMPKALSPEAMGQMQDSFASVPAIALNADVIRDGLKAHLIAFNNARLSARKPVRTDEEVARIPAGAAIVVCTNQMDKLRAALKQHMPGSPAPMVDVAGVDIYKDLIDHFKSLTAYYVPKPTKGMPGDVVLSFGVDDPKAISATLLKLYSAIVKEGGTSRLVKTGGSASGVVASIEPGVSASANLTDGKTLVVAVSGSGTAGAAKAQAQHGGLATSKRFHAVRSGLWDESSGFIYGDAGKLLALQRQIGPEVDVKDARAISDKVGPFGLMARTIDNRTEAILFIPFLH